MTPRGLIRLLVAYVALLVVSCLILRAVVSLHPVAGPIIATQYSKGERVSRTVLEREDAPTPTTGATLVYERVVSESLFIARPDPVFALSLVSGHDGVMVSLDGKTAYVTPDDLLAKQGYDHGLGVDALNLSIGADVSLIVALASGDLGARPSEVAHRATFRRIRTVREVPTSKLPSPVTADALTRDDLQKSLLDGARYLARGMSADGHLRYLVDAASNKTIFGYDWPRHAGATYFLVQAANIDKSPSLRSAALRALSLMRDRATVACGQHQCIGDPDALEIGSVALGTIAFAEAVRTGLNDSYVTTVRSLAETLLAAQRPDGEFMHQILRDGTPVDVQLLYFSGEATLALARAHSVTGDDRYLQGAKKGLAHLVGPAWSFFGDRYYFGEEHWTCQVMGDLWDRAPDPAALDFCERWQAYGRVLQMHEGESAFDCDGAIGVGPVVTPRLTPVASRGEAGVATLDVLQKIHASKERIEPLRLQLRRSLALLVRGQLRGQSDHLLSDPAAVHGAMPGSEVDWQLRIDYAQHAGSAMVRWLDVDAAPSNQEGAHGHT